MTPRLTLLCLCLTGMATLTGCGSREPQLAGAVPAPASRPDDEATGKRARIAEMYEGYRREAFPDVRGIDAAELRTGVERPPAVLVDCRDDRERAVSMIEGAISKDRFEADAASYHDRLIVPYCTIGYRSGVYAKALAARGFDVKNLVGGVLTWALEDGPFVDPRGRATRRVHVYGATWDLLPGTYESVYEGKPSP